MILDLIESEDLNNSEVTVKKPVKLAYLDAIKGIFEIIDNPEYEQFAIDFFEYIYGVMDMSDESKVDEDWGRFYSYRFETLDDAVDAFSHLVASFRYPSKEVSALLNDLREEYAKEKYAQSHSKFAPSFLNFAEFIKNIFVKAFENLMGLLFITKFVHQNSTNYLRFIQELLRIDFKGKTDELILFLKEKEKLLLVVSRNPHFQKSYTKVLPSELDNPEFKVILKKAIDAGFVVEDNNQDIWQGTTPQLAYFAEITSECLKLKSKYSPFCKLFNKKNLAQVRYKTKEYVGKVDRQDELDRLVRFD
ncbi:MAG: hypothetical protein RBR97_18425 [Bacteroidales bacterium]|nr:hypothetical protein [Bacteroidales bacterium]